MLKRFLYISLLLLGTISSYSQDIEQRVWVDTQLEKLSLEEKITQLMMVRAYSNKGKDHTKEIESLIKKYNIGGLTFFQGGPVRQANLTNNYQKIAKTPLLISLDAEWGLGMRLDSTFSFPYQMTLGAMHEDTLVYELASMIAEHLKRIGVQMNLAPVMDINNNPGNPVIGFRSFGEDKLNVSSKGLAYMKGLQDNGVLATAKHFPGHGDTDDDSHYTLPLVLHDKERLDTLELYPFRELINNGLDAIMIAHLYVKSVDASKNVASTLSKPLVTGLLKDEMKFEGLVVTDALDMQGVTKYHSSGEIEIKALLAGNDLLVLPQDVPKAIKKIKKAIKNDELSESLINEKCRKILEYKYRAGLNNVKPIEINGLYESLNDSKSKLIEWDIYEEAITLIKNNNNLLPLNKIDTLRTASVAIGADSQTNFQQMLSNFSKVNHFSAGKTPGQSQLYDLLNKLQPYNLIIIGLHNISRYPANNYGISDEVIDFVLELSKTKSVILNIFGNPYSLSRFKFFEDIDAIIVSYQDVSASQKISAQMIYGSLPFKGKLPVSVTRTFQVNTGLITKKNSKLKYAIPEGLGIDPVKLADIEALVIESINDSVFPGCQIIAAKDGEVFYQRSFGYHTYEKKTKVKNQDLYDLASLTKVFASTLAVMKLEDENKIDIDQKISSYLPFTKETNKENVIIREMMAHQARLASWIRFYEMTMNNGMPDSNIYATSISAKHPFRTGQGMYIHRDYSYVMFDTLLSSPIRNSSSYLYSDLGYYFLYRIIESIANQPFDKFLYDNFYKPLGCFTTCFQPREYFPLSRIIPTELDGFFRNQLIHGDVHDPGAAMLGGIAGHAGLFSDANDVAVILQMLVQNGEYDGKRYIDSTTIIEFSRCQFPLNDNRRGIGFDKPLIQFKKNGPVCRSASSISYGHSGFTGTYAWADPENGLIYVFLSNRVHPDATNWKISERNIRTRIHQIFYDAIGK